MESRKEVGKSKDTEVRCASTQVMMATNNDHYFKDTSWASLCVWESVTWFRGTYLALVGAGVCQLDVLDGQRPLRAALWVVHGEALLPRVRLCA